jgi:hypothetical protein
MLDKWWPGMVYPSDMVNQIYLEFAILSEDEIDDRRNASRAGDNGGYKSDFAMTNDIECNL